MNRVASFVLLIVTVAACGDDDQTVPTEILSADLYVDRCETPRKGKDAAGRAFPDKDGSLLDELLFLRSWTDDTYLWYREVPSTNPEMFDTPLDYFDILKSGVLTASGKSKDQFHFTYTTEEWLALSQSGVDAGFGIAWSLIASRPPRKLVVAYVEPGSPAALAGITRGTEGVTIDGARVEDSNDIAKLNEGLSPSAVGAVHTFGVIDRGGTTPHDVTMTSVALTSTPVIRVPLAPPFDKVGYLQFNDHIATAEKALVDEITKLKADGITDLVIDLRYNGGGYLAIAAELAYMIAGPTATAGKTFEKLQFNDKHPTTDPVTGAALTPQGFLDHSIDLAGNNALPEGTPLPHLDLARVFVLTGPGTCSASEAVMNGLAGVDVQVIQMGETTCGKPYGFYPQDNCGTTYFSIQFQGVNAKGYGDFADGFVPGAPTQHTGCVIPDDYTHELGDPAEARLARALAFIADPTAVCDSGVARSRNPLAAVDGVVRKPLWLQNAIMLPPKR